MQISFPESAPRDHLARRSALDRVVSGNDRRERYAIVTATVSLDVYVDPSQL